MILPVNPRGIAAVAGFLFVVALYLPFVDNGFLYDDYLVVLERQPARSIGDVARLFGESYYPTLTYYRPLSAATFALQRGLLGDDPLLFHALNAVLAGVAAFMAWLFLGLPRLGIGRTPALLAALIFAAHPVASSCALPVSGRDTLLALICILGSLYGFCRAGRGAYAMGLGFLVLALASKEAAATLPLLVLLADLFGMSEAAPGRNLRAVLARYLPILVVLAGYFAIRRALFPGFSYPLGNPADVALSYLYALQVMLVPFRELLYEPLAAAWFSWWRSGIVALVLAALATLAVRTDSAAKRRLGFWLGWFVVTLLPAANLVWQETRFAERYVLLSALALPALAATLASTLPDRPSTRRFTLVGGIVLLAACAAIVLGRGSYWQEEAFYRQWIGHAPGNVTAHYNFARVLDMRGENAQALEHYETALRLDPEHGGAHNNLGALLARQGSSGEAIEHLEAALRLDPGDPRVHNNLGGTLALAGRLGEAMRQFSAALDLEPLHLGAHTNLGHALVRVGETDHARAHFRLVLEIDPDYADAHYGMGTVLLSEGKPQEAAQRFRETLQIDPQHRNARAQLE